MTKEQILNEVATSKWQPKFEFTDDLDAGVDSILKPHEDYFLGLHEKVKEIIEREIKRLSGLNFGRLFDPRDGKITFADVCNWQKELFEEKYNKVSDLIFDWSNNPEKCTDKEFDTLCSLPNMHINLGIRQSNVKVGEWTPPHPMFLEDLKEMCFTILLNEHYFEHKDYYFIPYLKTGRNDNLIKYSLTEWYKIFQLIHFFEDLNGRLGEIVINILSYILTDKYLIKK